MNILSSDPPNLISFNYQNATSTDPSGTTIQCMPDGNPDIFAFQNWKHRSPNGVVILELSGNNDGRTSTLTLPVVNSDVRYQNTGYYECTVSNNIPNAAQQTEFKQDVYLSIQGLLL